MRRCAAVLIASLSLWLAPTAALAGSDAGTEETIVTLANDKTLSECVSAVPKPDCRTTDEADGKQLALLGILVAGMAFLGWKIASGVRSNNAKDPGLREQAGISGQTID